LQISNKSCIFAPDFEKVELNTMKKEVLEMPIVDEASAGNVNKKYYAADEAILFMEPRIRAMFR